MIFALGVIMIEVSAGRYHRWGRSGGRVSQTRTLLTERQQGVALRPADIAAGMLAQEKDDENQNEKETER